MSESLLENEDGVRLPSMATLVGARRAKIRAVDHLRIDEDLVECDIDVGGTLVISGALRGGSVVVGESLECAVLGGDQVRTDLWIGAPPESDRPVLLDGERALDEAASARKQSEDLLRLGREDPDTLDHDHRERLTLAEFELPALTKAERALEWRVRKLREFFDSGKVVVSKSLFPGLVVRVGLRPERFRCIEALSGPLVLEAHSGKQLILTLDAVDAPVHRHPAFECFTPRSTKAAAA